MQGQPMEALQLTQDGLVRLELAVTQDGTNVYVLLDTLKSGGGFQLTPDQARELCQLLSEATSLAYCGVKSVWDLPASPLSDLRRILA